jgi:hypothetical protein
MGLIIPSDDVHSEFAANNPHQGIGTGLRRNFVTQFDLQIGVNQGMQHHALYDARRLKLIADTKREKHQEIYGAKS